MIYQPDLSLGVNWSWDAMTEDSVLEFPLNTHKSMGSFVITQDPTGGRNLKISDRYSFRDGCLEIGKDGNARTVLFYNCDGKNVTLASPTA